MRYATAAGLVLGFCADRLLGDPRRGHPVAAFGRVASAAERRWWRDDRGRGAGYAAALAGGAAAAGAALARATPQPWARTGLVAAATWCVLGGRSLEREGEAMYALLSAVPEQDARTAGSGAGRPGEAAGAGPGSALAAARARLSHLCSRDATGLSAGELARATVESLAENTSDAVTAPLLWGALAGVPGLLGYRAANTLDAMVGYRSPRYANFGWAAARLDDVLNYLPARATALITVALAPLAGGSARAAWRAWRRDAPVHPSPNAGPVEASAAGALGVTLGGVSTYGGAPEDRGTLGDGPPAGVADVPRAVRLTRMAGYASLGLAVAVALARDQARDAWSPAGPGTRCGSGLPGCARRSGAGAGA